MNRDTIIEQLNRDETPVIDICDAVVKHVKESLKIISGYTSVWFKNVTLEDPVYGLVYFSSSASTVRDLREGDIISLKLKVTGISQETKQYPERVLWSRFVSRNGAKTIQVKRDNVGVVDYTIYGSDCEPVEVDY